jgi:hypothetical protein
MKLYKLTDEKNQTHNRTQWGINVTHETSGKGELCGSGWIHAYTSPLLAAFLNVIHADFKKPILWEARGRIGKTNTGLKAGCKKLTTIKQIPLPKITSEQKIKFAILCVKKVYKGKAWNIWADNWISKRNRTASAAEHAAIYAASAVAYAAYAAYAVAYAVYTVDAIYAAYAVAYAAHAAKYAETGLDLISIAREAVQ